MQKCPKCFGENIVKSGYIKDKQRYKCKNCQYFFTVEKLGKQIDDYYVTKALQLYLEGLSFREIERIIGVSHVSVASWVKKYNIQRPTISNSKSNYKIFKKNELIDYLQQENQLQGAGFIITEFGDKFMLIQWERFKN